MLWERGLEVRRGQVLTPWQQTLCGRRVPQNQACPSPSALPTPTSALPECRDCMLGHVESPSGPRHSLTHAETRAMRIAAVKQGGDEVLQDDFILPVLNLKPSPAKSNSSTITLGVFSCVTCRTLFTSSCYQACQDTA